MTRPLAVRAAWRFAAPFAALLAVSLALTPPAAAAPPGAIDSLRADLNRLAEEARVLRGELHLAQVQPGVAQRLEDRLNQLERLLGDLTGKLDDLTHQHREGERANEKFRNDIEYRLSEIEKRFGRAPAGARPPAAVPPSPPPGARPPAPPPGNRGALPPREPATAGTDPEKEPEPAGPKTAARAEGPVEQYEAAVGLVRRGDFAGATAALTDFVRRHPAHPLTANAYYWLGETHYAQRRYDAAAVAFADGYQRFPRHAKAPDNLVRLGVTFSRLNKRAEACAVFAKFAKDHPNAAPNLRQVAEAEKRRLACG